MQLTYITSAESNAITYYRQILPATHIRQNHKQDRIQVFHSGGPIKELERVAREADILIFQGVADERWMSWAKDLKEQEGIKVVIDLDDNIAQVSPYSPHYKDIGQEEVWYEENGKRTYIWKDGAKGFDLERNRKHLKNILDGLSVASLVTTTTNTLATFFRQYNDNVKVLPNCVDLTLWKRLPLKNHRGIIRVGWAGGYSHYEDWLMISEAVKWMMHTYPDITLVLMGSTFWGTLKGIAPERIETHSWFHHMAYPIKYASLDLDFALIPLVENGFNICKSPIKWIENGSLRIPCISSNIPPYSEMDTEAGIFAENAMEAWQAAIEIMVTNHEARKEMGNKAYKHVLDNYSIETQYHRWHETYKELMQCQPTSNCKTG